MKPLGPIPDGFSCQDGELVVGGLPVSTVLEQAGHTPLFVYDFALVKQKIALFRSVFGPVKLHYAIKANPYAPLLKAIAPWVDGFDVASAQEIRLAVAAGMDPAHISFAGPGKRDADLVMALELGVTINCESFFQIERALALGAQMGVRPQLAVRVNPDFEIKGSGMRMGGGAKQFGIDADQAVKACKTIVDSGADWRGLHIFSGSQSLDAEALIAAQSATLDLARAIIDEVGVPAPFINLGGGFGIPYFHKDSPLDVARVSAALLDALRAVPAEEVCGTTFAIELGRWLVGEAGVYLTRVIDAKISRGQAFAITDGGMHHHLAASGNFGQVLRRNYPVAIANKMGFIREGEDGDTAPQLSAQSPQCSPFTEVHIVGCLCTPLDKIAESALLPHVAIGDIVAVFASGAYGLNSSPQAFLHQEPAQEILLNP